VSSTRTRRRTRSQRWHELPPKLASSSPISDRSVTDARTPLS
jgi:hypothetical protein